MSKSQIDFVVTWVDGNDPVWCEKKRKHTGGDCSEGNFEVRFRDWDTLKYWFRGVEKFAPWVRYIYFVTDNQKPEWLNLENPKLKWIRHTDYIPEKYLPTFNSHTIEWNFYRIKGLSEHFVYFNDDVFLIRETRPEDFFLEGKPCDMPQIGALYPSVCFDHLLFNNAMMINRHFSLKKSLRRNWRKWLKNQPIKELLKLVVYGQKDQVPGIDNWHIQACYKKSTFETLWQEENDWIDATCHNKLRSKTDVTPWCIRNWQLLSGDFYAKKPIGKAFSSTEMEGKKGAAEYIIRQKGKVVCVNDNETEAEFEIHKQMLIEAFETILPEKSSFEL